MGSLQAGEMRAMLPEEQALEWHLQYNHYPPINLVFLPIALKALELAREDKWGEVIEMPNGKSLTVSEIIEGLHLDTFLEEANNG